MATSSPTLSARMAASETGVVSWIIGGLELSLVKPFLGLSVRVERHTLAPIRPTHVADADEIGGGQAIQHANLGAKQGGLAAETHWADAKLVRGLDNVLLQLAEFRIWVGVVEPAKELLLRILVAGRSIPADADAEDARPAAFALGLQHRVEDRLAAAVQVAVGFKLLVGKGVLGTDVFTAAAF